MNKGMRRCMCAAIACLMMLFAAAQAEEAYVISSASVYGSASASSEKLGTVKAGVKLTLIGEKEGWAKVELNGNTGFMKASALTEVLDKTVYAQSEGAKVYVSASTSAKVAGTLELNEEVRVDSVVSGWCRVLKGSGTYFIRKSDLGPEKVAEAAAKFVAYAQADGVKVYASNSTSAKVLGQLGVNAAVTVVDTREDWCKVEKNGDIAFMRKADLGKDEVQEKQQGLSYGQTGESVKKMQTRLQELGYFTGSIGGNYLGLTKSAVSRFQSAAKMTVTGEADLATLEAMFSENAPKASVATGESTAKPATGSAREMDWWTSDIRSIFSVGTVATITDVKTGISWQEIRKGGTNHADVQPVTAEDTAAMKKACGGSWSWDRRAIIVTIDGVNYAASMNCMPHGSGSITNNNFSGHHCIHFTNSRTHGSNSVCPLHQAAIKVAAAWKA